MSREHNIQPSIKHPHTKADDISAAAAERAYNEGKWEKFMGAPLSPIVNEPTQLDDRYQEARFTNERHKAHSPYPDFYVSTSEAMELTEKQKELAATHFNDLFVDIILQNMDQVKRFESTKGIPSASLIKSLLIDGQEYSMTLDDRAPRETDEESDIETRNIEAYSRDISLLRIDGIRGREYWSYRLGADNVVRRYDVGDIYGNRRGEKELGVEQAGKIAIQGLNERTDYEAPNVPLEDYVYLNNVPTSQQEILGLKEFIRKAS